MFVEIATADDVGSNDVDAGDVPLFDDEDGDGDGDVEGDDDDDGAEEVSEACADGEEAEE